MGWGWVSGRRVHTCAALPVGMEKSLVLGAVKKMLGP